MAEQLPNIVFICTDQQRNDSLGCCGNPEAVTPHLDRLAADGVRFTRHNTPCPICSPSRATMFTGLYPRHHGLTVNGMALDPRLPTLPAELARAGYRTYGIGKHHFQPILAPAHLAMPESEAFWQRPEADGWQGPYYGLEKVQFVIGEADQAGGSGHYARWLRKKDPRAAELLTSGAALDTPPKDLDEVWKCGLPAEWHYNSWITRQAVDTIKRASSPFFLFVSYPDPHHPFSPPRPYCDLFDKTRMPMPKVRPGELDEMPPYYRDVFSPGEGGFLDAYWGSAAEAEQGFLLNTARISNDALRRAIAHTYGMVNMIDEGVGEILRALDNTGLTEQTIVLFTSDHGELLGDHGLLHKGPPAYRQIREIPLLMKGPGLPAGKTIDALTSHTDLMPTLLELAGVDIRPAGAAQPFDGLSLSPLLDGRRSKIRATEFGEYHPRSPQQLYNQTIQTERWRLTLYPQHPDWGELFDLEADPYENSNCYNRRGYGSIVRKLTARLQRSFPPCRDIPGKRIAKW